MPGESNPLAAASFKDLPLVVSAMELARVVPCEVIGSVWPCVVQRRITLLTLVAWDSLETVPHIVEALREAPFLSFRPEVVGPDSQDNNYLLFPHAPRSLGVLYKQVHDPCTILGVVFLAWNYGKGARTERGSCTHILFLAHALASCSSPLPHTCPGFCAQPAGSVRLPSAKSIVSKFHAGHPPHNKVCFWQHEPPGQCPPPLPLPAPNPLTAVVHTRVLHRFSAAFCTAGKANAATASKAARP